MQRISPLDLTGVGFGPALSGLLETREWQAVPSTAENRGNKARMYMKTNDKHIMSLGRSPLDLAGVGFAPARRGYQELGNGKPSPLRQKIGGTKPECI